MFEPTMPAIDPWLELLVSCRRARSTPLRDIQR
jgi:hypothetical protein